MRPARLSLCTLIATGSAGTALTSVTPETAIVWSGLHYADGCSATSLCTVIEPALPQYHFSLFWFSLGIIGAVVALYDLVRKQR